jgi:ParB family chromosome partitioning protein
MKKITFKKFEPNLPMEKIQVGEKNVRTSQLQTDLDKLEGSVEQLNLIQPVIVLERRNHYDLIVGQRRYRAFEALKKPTIPALIIEPIDSLTQTIVSFGENVHRRKLPYQDTIRVCDELYKAYTGTKTEKINKIVKTLGLSRGTVTRYLAYKLIPAEVQQLVEDGKLSQDVAYRITSSYFPNKQKIVSVAKNAARMTKSETRRAIDYGNKKPDATIEEIMEYAKNPPPIVEITIQIDHDTEKALKELADRKKSTVIDLVKDAIDRMIEDET